MKNDTFDADEKLIECVPNFSEGRRQDVIEAIRDTITADGRCELWDYSSDADHNRSVFTLAGPADALEETVLRFTAKAAELIDMRTHEGVHPCIGATDVIPFIPLQNVTMAECAALAEKTGKRIAEELGLPVYLYANAARTPAHRRLADIRRGGYHTLKNIISTDPDRAPDLGPRSLPPAGGVSIGARDFLIAFNVYLDSVDVSPARIIAKRIRESSGGLPGVQAIGLSVNGLAQVSMNLLNYRKSSMKTVFEKIKKEADSLGIGLRYSELIGMLPADALAGTSPEELLIRNFNRQKIIPIGE